MTACHLNVWPGLPSVSPGFLIRDNDDRSKYYIGLLWEITDNRTKQAQSWQKEEHNKDQSRNKPKILEK